MLPAIIFDMLLNRYGLGFQKKYYVLYRSVVRRDRQDGNEEGRFPGTAGGGGGKALAYSDRGERLGRRGEGGADRGQA